MIKPKLLEISNSIIKSIHQSEVVDIDALDTLAILDEDGQSCSFEMQKYHDVKDGSKFGKPIGRIIYKVTITESYEKYEDD